MADDMNIGSLVLPMEPEGNPVSITLEKLNKDFENDIFTKIGLSTKEVAPKERTERTLLVETDKQDFCLGYPGIDPSLLSDGRSDMDPLGGGGMLTIDDLPEEVLLEVFSYLLLPDRKHVRLVNKQWNALCNSARLTKHESIRLEGPSVLESANISSAIINLKVSNVEITNALPFWKENGRRVKSLKISCSSIIYPALCDVINYCPNIEFLSLFFLHSTGVKPDCKTDAEIACNKLESLLELQLHDCILDFTLDMLTRNVPNLKHFTLTISYDFDECNNILTHSLTLLEKQFHTLETLCFNGYNFVNDSFLNGLCEQVGVQLTGLFIPRCSNVTDNFLFAVAMKFVNLESLDLSDNLQLGRNMDPTLFSNLKKLKLVRLSLTSITNQVLSAVAALEQIEGLDLSCCESLTAEGISRALGFKLHEKILDIRLGNVWCDDQVLSQILPQLPNLRSIDLTSCDEITSVGVSAITTNCKLLRFLSLAVCSELNSLTFPDMNDLKGLLYLNLSKCPLDVDTVSKLKYLELQVINLMNVPLTVEGLTSLLVDCPSLQHVKLSRNSEANLRQAGMEEILKNCHFVDFDDGDLSPGTIFDLSACHFNKTEGYY